LNFPSITSYYPGDKSAGLMEPPPIHAALGPNAHPSTNQCACTGTDKEKEKVNVILSIQKA